VDSLARLQSCVWLPRKSRGSNNGVAPSTVIAEARRFLLRLCLHDDDAAPPIETIFTLEKSSTPAPRRSGALAFTWTNCGGFPLPSMRGEFVTRRFGPFVGLFVRINYAYDGGPAGRLFHEAVGEALARQVFKKLVSLIKRAVLESREQPFLIRDEASKTLRSVN
jgi:hypothetical protein